MCSWISNLNKLLTVLRIKDPELVSRIIVDEKEPDYIIATDSCYCTPKFVKQLKYYLSNFEKSIFIFYTGECIDADLTLFDYAITCNSEVQCGDRITRNVSYFCNIDNNTLTREDAQKILENSPKFCNFLYSHAQEPRGSFFHMLSRYKRVDSLGRHLNNTGIQSTRSNTDWYNLSIEAKRGYKFSLAMENAAYKGYTTEKIITSLQARTVPIYWGDPTVSELINPKAFINCADYDSFGDVIERVKEIDNDNEKWLDIVTQPWQTDEQKAKTLELIDKHDKFIRSIFYRNIKKARRRPVGVWADSCKKGFTGNIGILPPLHIKVYRKVRHLLAKLLVPAKYKQSLQKFLRI